MSRFRFMFRTGTDCFVAKRWRSSHGGCRSIGSFARRIPELSLKEDRPFVESFHPFFEQQKPVVLRQYAGDFPAVELWKSLDYLEQVVGPDVPCDVEMGAYNQGQKLTISFGDYIQYLRVWKETHDVNDESTSRDMPSDQLLYLAQNDLSMLGGLSQDIQVPSFCSDGRLGHGRLYSVMLWLGPRGCISPLHFDPLDNLLMQIVGSKRVTLIPKDTDPSCLYTGHDHGQQNNTSAVDVETPDLHRYPLFERARAQLQSTVLEPGDVLFIPSKWWHHVRSIDLSISVNVWWR